MSITDLKEIIAFIGKVIESEPTRSDRFKQGIIIYQKLTNYLAETEQSIIDDRNFYDEIVKP